MVQIIVGEKGKGKTKILIDKVNADVKTVKGDIVYLDKSNKNIYELNNKIRLINVKDYFIETPQNFLGFVCGLIANNHDLQKVYLDSFLKIACHGTEELDKTIEKLELISAKFNVDFVLSISAAADQLSEATHKLVIVSL